MDRNKTEDRKSDMKKTFGTTLIDVKKRNNVSDPEVPRPG